tara:strand:+ start:915 stop:1172 length:258 start_codon:yes stop_codon:yes gene_type:complete
MNMNVEEVQNTQVQAPNQVGQQQKQVKLSDLTINSENDALNYMVGFLELAQRRGVYTLEEAAKINECVAKFRKEAPQQQSTETSQ